MLSVVLALEGQQDHRQRWLLALAGAEGAFVFPEVPPGKYVAGVLCCELEDDASSPVGERPRNERLEVLGEVSVAAAVGELVVDLKVPKDLKLR